MLHDVDHTETAGITYLAQVTDWLAVQISLHCVFNPGTNPALRDATVAVLRFELSLQDRLA